MEEIFQFVGIVRRIWLRRNEVVHEGSFLHPNTLVHRAKMALEDFLVVSPYVTAKSNLTTTHGVQCWCALDSGWVKVNWDASLAREVGRIGFGAVVRDNLGLVVAAQSVTVFGCLDPTLTEAGAILKAIQLCRSLGLQRVIF
jgi:hypothetical protein